MTVSLAIQLVIFGLTSLRGACRAAAILVDKFKDDFPCHVAVQTWVMRFGLYRLTKALKHRNDWIYVLDYTIDFGAKKCLVILGMTLESFREHKCCPIHQDMETISIEIHSKTCAATVRDAIARASIRTGIPAQIVSDHGSDVKKGIELFLENHPQTKYTYDVTHKTAVLLKRHLKQDNLWQQFVEKACASKRASVHTKLAFLAPPKPKDKARWLNLDAHIEWAERLLILGNKNPDQRRQDVPEFDQEKFEEIFGWLREFKNHFAEWRCMLDLLTAAKDEVKLNGISRKSAGNFEKRIAHMQFHTERLCQLKEQLLTYMVDEGAVPKKSSVEEKEGPWLGCSDIIESVIGKYKNFSARTPMKEVGKTVLTIPAFTSSVTPAEVKQAMQEVSTEDLKNWLDENVGESLFAARKKAFFVAKTEKSVKIFPEMPEKAANF